MEMIILWVIDQLIIFSLSLLSHCLLIKVYSFNICCNIINDSSNAHPLSSTLSTAINDEIDKQMKNLTIEKQNAETPRGIHTHVHKNWTMEGRQEMRRTRLCMFRPTPNVAEENSKLLIYRQSSLNH